MNTWRAFFPDITFAANKNMAALLNGGSRLIKVRRVGFVTAALGAVTGTLGKGEIRRYTSAGLSGHTTVTPIPYDSTNSALDTITAGYAGTPTGSYVNLASYIWSTDEPVVSAGSWDELQTFTLFGTQIDFGYADPDVQSIALRPNEMICVYHLAGAVNQIDIWIEFTDEA